MTAIEALSPAIIHAQIEAVFDDLAIDAVKIGMLGGPEAIRAVAGALRGRGVPVVLDPVMVAKSGDRLLDLAGALARQHRLAGPELDALLARVVALSSPDADTGNISDAGPALARGDDREEDLQAGHETGAAP